MIIVLNRPQVFASTIEECSKMTNFSPTYFEIYDKSTAEKCNRLIYVRPFEWMILANVGKVMVINDTTFECPLSNTPAVVVPSVAHDDNYNFQNVCMTGDLSNIVLSYRSVAPIFVPFSIEDGQEPDKFTMLDALNLLFKEYITIDVNKNENSAELYHSTGTKLRKEAKINQVKMERMADYGNHTNLTHMIQSHYDEMYGGDNAQNDENNANYDTHDNLTDESHQERRFRREISNKAFIKTKLLKFHIPKKGKKIHYKKMDDLHQIIKKSKVKSANLTATTEAQNPPIVLLNNESPSLTSTISHNDIYEYNYE